MRKAQEPQKKIKIKREKKERKKEFIYCNFLPMAGKRKRKGSTSVCYLWRFRELD